MMGIYIKNMEKPKRGEVIAFDGENAVYTDDDLKVHRYPLIEIDLVRCGECKYAKYRIENIEYDKCMIKQLFVNKNDFCSYGEPRESEYVAKD